MSSDKFAFLIINVLFQVTSWFEVARRFEDGVGAVLELYDRLMAIPNKSLLSDIFPYLWDLRGVLQTCCAYVKWMGNCQFLSTHDIDMHGPSG